ncbi:hypothetical protein FACS189459_7340 [Bacilli bacterium]|nr:hypothetical protein FACS189459_7340 [Bacilli bacterium]
MLYIEALVKNYNLNNSKHRTDEYSHMTNEDMHKEISKNNPALAQRIDVCNRKRLLRGMELIKDDEFDINDKNPPKYEPIYIYTYMDRETIYERINKRVELMLDNG